MEKLRDFIRDFILLFLKKYLTFTLFFIYLSFALVFKLRLLQFGHACIVALVLFFAVIVCREYKLLDERRMRSLENCLNVCFVLLSGFHGAFVLGRLSYGTYILRYIADYFLPRAANLFFFMLFYWVLYLTIGKSSSAIGVGNLIIGLLGTVNHYLMRFRGSPLYLSQFSGLRTALEVASQYNYTPDADLLFYLLDLLLWWLLLRATKEFSDRRSKGEWFTYTINAVMLSCLLYFCTPSVMANAELLFQEDFKTSQSGAYLMYFYVDAKKSIRLIPDDYSLEKVDALIEEIEADCTAPSSVSSVQSPNIIVVMNESFSDLRTLGSFETSEPLLPYLNALSENVIRGTTNVSMWGGGTCNVELDFLSSGIFSALYSIYPYNSLFHAGEFFPSLVSILEQQGYSTAAFHSHYSSSWNRPAVYDAMGFDQVLFRENVENELSEEDYVHNYVSDKAHYRIIENIFENKEVGEPLFLFNVTMQNHGGYPVGECPRTVHLTDSRFEEEGTVEGYLSLVQETDRATAELLEYFANYSEPTIILFFGDHQPKLTSTFYRALTGTEMEKWDQEQTMRLYKTPFYIWHNYPTESREIGDVSVNYLAALLMQDAGLSMSDYQLYSLDMYQRYPVITMFGAMDADGALYSPTSEEYHEIIDNYHMLTVNHIVDQKNRREEFFSLIR